MRTFDTDIVHKATEQYREHLSRLNIPEWLSNLANIALTNGTDVSLFERELKGVVTGHYFFLSRGKAAVKVAEEMLDEIFTGPYDVEVIRGMTPLENLGARWMNKRLGFKNYGALQTSVGPIELVILTKAEWQNLKDTNNG